MKNFRDKILWISAHRLLKKYKPVVIAVGGAIAKTSTKEAIGSVLKAAFPGQVAVGYGNLNTYIGVPLSILGFKIDFHKQKFSVLTWIVTLLSAVLRSFAHKLPRYLVLEYGTDKPGDIPALVAQLRPDIAILTIAGSAHLANYSSEKAIADEEGSLVEAVASDGYVLLNKQDPYLELHRSRVSAEMELIDAPLEHMAVEFAAAVGRKLGVDSGVIKEALTNRELPARRFNRYKLRGVEILDDCYNANPVSMRAALNLLKGMAGSKTAVLGSMLELGDTEVKLHEEIGEVARGVADKIIGVGELAKHYQPDKWYPNSDEAAQDIEEFFPKSGSLLIKGSRGIRLEKITEKFDKWKV